MSYLPELRSSLVRAAARQADVTTRAASPPRRRRSFGGVALIGASLAALAVAAIVLVLAGHRSNPAPAPAAPAPTSPGAAAAQLLAKFHPPAGATLIGADPTPGRQLRAAAQRMPVPGGIDLYRIYRLSGDPETVVNALANAMRRDEVNTGTSSSASVGDSGGPSGGSATQVLGLEMRGGLARSFQLRAVALPHGVTVLRVDAQAWPPMPRPASERLPAHADAVAVQLIGTPPSSAVHPPGRLTGGDVAAAITLLNGLGIVQPNTPACEDSSNFRIRLTFRGTGQHPDPVAVVRPGCNTIDLTLAGRVQQSLTFDSSASSVDILSYVRFMESLLGLPRSKTLRDAYTLLGTTVSGSSSSSSSGSATATAQAKPAKTR